MIEFYLFAILSLIEGNLAESIVNGIHLAGPGTLPKATRRLSLMLWVLVAQGFIMGLGLGVAITLCLVFGWS